MSNQNEAATAQQASTEQDSGKNTITIQSYKFDVETRYVEGHTLSENEASALQGLLQENVRNNFAKTIKGLVEENKGQPLNDGQLEKIQKIFTKFVSEYEFGKRRVAAVRSLNPLDKEVKRIATEKLKEILASKGKSWTETPKDQRNALIARIIEINPAITQLAQSNIDSLNSIKL